MPQRSGPGSTEIYVSRLRQELARKDAEARALGYSDGPLRPPKRGTNYDAGVGDNTHPDVPRVATSGIQYDAAGGAGYANGNRGYPVGHSPFSSVAGHPDFRTPMNTGSYMDTGPVDYGSAQPSTEQLFTLIQYLMQQRKSPWQ